MEETSSSEIDAAEFGTYRQYSGWMGKLVKAIPIFLVLFTVVYVLGLPNSIGIRILPPAFGALHLASVLFLGFLLMPATSKSPRDRLPWYDAALALMAIPWNLYLFFNYRQLEEMLTTGQVALPAVIFVSITVLIVMEAARRGVGSWFPAIVALFIIYALTASYWPGLLKGVSADPERLVRYVGLGVDGLYGPLLYRISATIVASFLIFGGMLNALGGGDFINRMAIALFGSVRGGPAKMAVVASAGFGMISGSAAANVTTTGVFTIPMMKKTGYKPNFAGAVEAVASSGGHIMPPVMGSTVFLMAQFLGVPYQEAVVAGFLPAIFYYLALFIMVDLEAGRLGLRGTAHEEKPPVRATLASGWMYPIPVAVLLIAMFVLYWSPQKAAVYATIAFILVLLFFARKQLSLSKLMHGTEIAVRSLVLVTPLIALSAVIAGTMAATGISYRLTSILLAAAGGNLYLLLILTAFLSVALGMGLPIVAVYATVGLMMAPALIQLGIVPMAAHLFVVWMALLSGITPPVCEVAFVAAAIARGDPMRTGWQACRLGIVAYLVPFMFVVEPAFLLMGAFSDVAWTVFTALIGVTALSAGMIGYMLTATNRLQRIGFLAGGILLFIPGWQTDAAGFAILAATMSFHISAWRAQARLKRLAV